MNISIDVPAEVEDRVKEAFCTDRIQEDETEEECVNRIVTAYVNQVVTDYERNKRVEEAHAQADGAPVL
jgi:hypothetical protein